MEENGKILGFVGKSEPNTLGLIYALESRRSLLFFILEYRKIRAIESDGSFYD